MHPPEKHDWSRDLVVGVVTNNNDPDQMGRVRVKYPSLSDSEESAWARIASVSAGNERGADDAPAARRGGDRRLRARRHPAADRLGSLFNGKDKPGDDLLQNRDGSFAVVSNEKALIHTKKDFEIKSDQKMIDRDHQRRDDKAQGKIEQEASQGTKLKAGTTYEIEAGSTMTIKGVSVTVEASALADAQGRHGGRPGAAAR